MATAVMANDEELAADLLRYIDQMIERRMMPFTRGDRLLGSAIAGYIGQNSVPQVPLAKVVPDLPVDPLDAANQRVQVNAAGDALEIVDTAAMDAAAKVMAWTLFV